MTTYAIKPKSRGNIYMKTSGMTLKQMALHQYFKAIDAYKQASKAKDKHGLIVASLQIMANKGAVPRRLWRYSNWKHLTSEVVA